MSRRSLGVHAVDADVGYGGGHPAHTETRMWGEGANVGERELSLLPLAQQEVVEGCVIVIEAVLHSLEKRGN